MNKPLRNALFAELYIIVIVLGSYYGPRLFGEVETILAPIAFLSLFVLSAAIMGYLFCYEPIAQYIDGKKEEAIRHFIQTVTAFGFFTLCIFGVLLVYALLH
jgi:hypothetical protein